MHSRRLFLQQSLLAASSAGFSLNSLAKAAEISAVPQSSRILVGFGAGGGIDLLARVLAENIAAQLGRSHYVVVDNKPGANGQIAAQTLLNAPSDGSTYLIAPLITPVLSQIVYKKPGYDPARDFSPVGLLAHFQFGLAVPARHPARNIQEYVAWLKANPEKANFGSPAVGSLPHFFGLLLGEAAGVNIVHVPYKGGPAMMTDLISGQLASAIQTTSELAPLHKEGKVRILGTFGNQRSRELPDVPTFAEAGYPKATGSGWYSLWARKGTSPEAIAAVNRAVNHALLDPKLQPRWAELSLQPDPRTPQALEQLRVAEVAKWRPVIANSGFAIE
ncbi:MULTISPECIES: tripartite tricarboxylate transporter substrate-binding protein [Comamonas]|uniref:tripartite tricarboxylate transporter substrate-binding protein n=1 Tax=Comamonas TaxID=283 RepID=UPI0001BB0D74|nr:MULTISPECIES: tripartite tricarboxylate transporter substrate-binding protein [Comamonas]ACY31840.1 Twin-arginine translocation pathway signal [Comamonas thiooxydans]MDO1474431.1 Twin-arginine translocation pathway signal [Comamonas thiooxydans]QOQ83422.1 Twin-arginine translocation pathway signal [Comamonas thiooxydans]